jgi:hypothetical protein
MKSITLKSCSGSPTVDRVSSAEASSRKTRLYEYARSTVGKTWMMVHCARLFSSFFINELS